MDQERSRSEKQGPKVGKSSAGGSGIVLFKWWVWVAVLAVVWEIEVQCHNHLVFFLGGAYICYFVFGCFLVCLALFMAFVLAVGL